MKVSIIMPTARERMFDRLPAAIEAASKQDWPDLELLAVHDTVIHFHTRSWMRQNHPICIPTPTIGEKRNLGALHANGEIIVHMDDDDHYAPDWISRSVAHLMQSKAQLTGLNAMYYQQGAQVLRWDYPRNAQPYVAEATMCYWRKMWEANPFPDMSEGEGRAFCANAGRIVAHGYADGFLATLHGANTCSHLAVPGMKRVNYAHPLQQGV